ARPPTRGGGAARFRAPAEPHVRARTPALAARGIVLVRRELPGRAHLRAARAGTRGERARGVSPDRHVRDRNPGRKSIKKLARPPPPCDQWVGESRMLQFAEDVFGPKIKVV